MPARAPSLDAVTAAAPAAARAPRRPSMTAPLPPLDPAAAREWLAGPAGGGGARAAARGPGAQDAGGARSPPTAGPRRGARLARLCFNEAAAPGRPPLPPHRRL